MAEDCDKLMYKTTSRTVSEIHIRTVTLKPCLVCTLLYTKIEKRNKQKQE